MMNGRAGEAEDGQRPVVWNADYRGGGPLHPAGGASA